MILQVSLFLSFQMTVSNLAHGVYLRVKKAYQLIVSVGEHSARQGEMCSALKWNELLRIDACTSLILYQSWPMRIIL